MEYIYVDAGKCRGCRICVKSCPFDNIRVANGVSVIGKDCVLCQKCISYCPFDAITLREKKQ